MLEKCIECQKLGVDCNGSAFTKMTTEELVNWCKARKRYLGLSNQKIADLANLPKGTVDSFFAAAHQDFRYETIRLILSVLAHSAGFESTCPQLTSNERESLQNAIESQITKINSMDQIIHQLEDVASYRKRIIRILAWSLALILVLIIVSLLLDKLNPNQGWIITKL